MQPTFLPWLGFFDLIDQSDIFIFYDDVQFKSRSWQTRNRISINNQIVFVNLLVKKAPQDTKIQDIQLVDNDLNFTKLLKTMHHNHKKQIHFEEVYSFLHSFFSIKYEKLSDINIAFIKEISLKLGITTKLDLSSNFQKKSDDRVCKLIELCQLNNCETYLSAKGSAEYIFEEDGLNKFSNSNVDLIFQNYTPYQYKEKDFIPFMSILDCLFYHGFENTIDIIRKGRNQNQKLFDFYENQ